MPCTLNGEKNAVSKSFSHFDGITDRGLAIQSACDEEHWH